MIFWVFQDVISTSTADKSHNCWHSTYSSAASASMRPSHKALSLSAHLPPSHPAICYMGRSALTLWMDSTPPPAKKKTHNDSDEFTQNELPDGSVCMYIWVRCTLSQYQPALTPSLSCPMVTLLRGLRSEAISTLKMSVRPRSNFPPARNTCKHMKELIGILTHTVHTVSKGRFNFFTVSALLFYEHCLWF